MSSQDVLTNFVSYLEKISKNSGGTKIVLIAHNGAFDFPVFINSLSKFSLLDRLKTLDISFLDSLKAIRSLDVLKNAETSLSFSSIFNSLFAKDFNAHDALADCKALSEILWAIVPDMNVNHFENYIITTKELKRSIDARENFRGNLISLQALPSSKSMKEKIAKAGIGFHQLRNVLLKYGSKGLLALLSLPTEGLSTRNSKAPPRVTKHRKTRKVLEKILNFSRRKSSK